MKRRAVLGEGSLSCFFAQSSPKKNGDAGWSVPPTMFTYPCASCLVACLAPTRDLAVGARVAVGERISGSGGYYTDV